MQYIIIVFIFIYQGVKLLLMKDLEGVIRKQHSITSPALALLHSSLTALNTLKEVVATHLFLLVLLKWPCVATVSILMVKPITLFKLFFFRSWYL